MSAVRIISIDDKKDAFELDEKALQSVLSKVPEDLPISIVSVVGAFRTGKSFLLDFFLRYLHATKPSEVDFLDENSEPDQSWMTKPMISSHKGSILEGNLNTKESDKIDDHALGGFGWRSGKDRCTTGIWIWSDYFVRYLPKDPSKPSDTPREKVAVLLLDTQGMFDSTMGQMLTASIFGLSTLISSYQIYNLDKRVQEDNLQHLALFTEYGRVALQEEERQKRRQSIAEGNENESSSKDDFDSSPSILRTTSRKLSTGGVSSILNNNNNNNNNWESDAYNEGEILPDFDGEHRRPFQRLELLVRDWQNFDDEDGNLQGIHEDMRTYLAHVLDERDQKDLKQVRDQIHDCFESVSCFLLPHPGLEVPKRTYDGELTKLSPSFRRLLSDYCRKVFSTRLVPKRIYGRCVSAQELFVFVKAYALLFKEAKIFPEAKTLLAATSEANNRAAVDIAIKVYRAAMEPHAGPNRPFVEHGKLQEYHLNAKQLALRKFHTIATLGPRSDISEYKRLLEQDLAQKYKEYDEANKLRDPFSFVGPFVLPLMLGFGCYFMRIFLDSTCSAFSDSCVTVANFLSMIYTTIFTFLLFHLLATGHGVRHRIQQIFGMINNEPGSVVNGAFQEIRQRTLSQNSRGSSPMTATTRLTNNSARFRPLSTRNTRAPSFGGSSNSGSPVISNRTRAVSSGQL